MKIYFLTSNDIVYNLFMHLFRHDLQFLGIMLKKRSASHLRVIN